ncbi:hypothetical protein C2S52_013205 [Perilla frutescens var. hirtella]|nr:hypothetical protein C2S52_013205 [Perilla frutescens var. hirtella]
MGLLQYPSNIRSVKWAYQIRIELTNDVVPTILTQTRPQVRMGISVKPGNQLEERWCEHKEELKQNGCTNVEKEHEDSFIEWFEQLITVTSIEEDQPHHENLLHLAYGLDTRVTHHEGFIVNGMRFHTKRHDMNKKTQNYGVAVKVDEGSGFQDYYGMLVDIVQLDYFGNHHVTLFKCDWYESKSVQKDKYNYTSVNVSKPWKTSEPYVLATQAEQLFYVDDIKLGNEWKVIIQTQVRSLWNVVENQENDCIMSNESYQQNESHCTIDRIQCPDDFVEWCRNDIPASTAVSPIIETSMEGDVDKSEDDEDEGEDCDDGDDDTDEGSIKESDDSDFDP